MAEVSVTQLLRQRQDEFIENRTKIETEVDMFLKSISVMDADLRVKCGYREGVTARHLLPALWAEPFDMATYEVQLAKFSSYVAQVVAICDAVVEEAKQCLQT